MPALPGREADLRQLAALWRDAQEGRGRIAVVLAEPGGGKSALLEAFADTFQPGDRILWGTCADGDGGLPYWPWLNAFGAAEATALLEHSGSEADRFEQFHAAANAILTLGPTLIVIDDLHWADGASLQFLEFFAPFIRRSSILLVVASRPEPRAPVQAVLGTLIRRNAVRLELRPLTLSEVAVLLEPGAADLAREVARLSGGNPLLATEYARHLQTGGDATRPPSSFASLVQAELRWLTPGAQRLAAVCSLIDGLIYPEMVLAAAQTSAETLDELFAASLLLKRTGRWRHDALREATRDALPPSERHGYEAALAEACARAGDESGVAVHGCRAGAAWDPAKAHATALAQARRWAARYSLEFAEGYVDLARSVRRLVQLAPAERLEIEVFEGELLTQLHRGDAARAALREAAELSRSLGRPDILAQVALSFGLGHEHGYARDPEVIALLKEALEGLPDADHASRAKLLARLAWQSLGPREVTARRQFAEDSVREARMAEDPAALAAALLALCWGLAAPEDLARRRAAADEATLAAEDARDVDLQLGALFRQFLTTLELGDIPAARRAAADFDTITERCPLPYHRWNAYLFNATLALIAGDVDRAQAVADQIDPASTGQPMQAEVMLCALVGHINAQRGGEAAVRGARLLFEELERYMGAGWLLRPRAVVDTDIEAARDLLVDAVARLLAAPVDEDRLAFLSLLAEAAILCGAKEECVTLFEALLPFASHWVVIANGAGCRGPVAAFLAGTARVGGLEAEARQFEASARADIARNDAPGMLVWLDLEPRVRQPRAESAPGGLSPREAEVLALVARGHSNQEIADALVLSVRTVHRHVENVYGRLGIHNRAEAALKAVELGLIAPRDVRAPAG
ncbi:MAG: AAA family ATPase [Dehalococcoidia bacterium]